MYINDFPLSFNDIYDSNPDILHIINDFLVKLDQLFKPFDSLRLALRALDRDNLYIYLTLLRYFPNFVTYLYRRYFKILNMCNISYFYRFLTPYNYIYPTNSVTDIVSSYVRDYIRDGIHAGLQAGIPFLAFPLYSSNTFMPLCKFYRDRYTDDTDVQTLYSILGVRNFDEWQALFEKYVRNSKSLYPQGNKLLRESEILPQFVENGKKTIKNLYNYLFVK